MLCHFKMAAEQPIFISRHFDLIFVKKKKKKKNLSQRIFSINFGSY